ncbi:RNA-binding protein YhbY [Chromobacterium violaceum]|uniref:RNA-binding protein YhbY n=1 Tax=Chromobacterium violaceum TaxID=536 RepID=A0A3S4J4N2_CHRVL|nr:RNA-binding protein YhbY [Chromobacterium violaceum]
MVGNNGLTEAVVREIAISLDAHELIKVRVLATTATPASPCSSRSATNWAAPCAAHRQASGAVAPSDKARIALPKNKQAMKD